MVSLFKHRATASVVLFAFISALTTSATYTWPNQIMDELEHLLVDTGGFNDGGIKNAITPCTNYASGVQTLGRETSAQWLRVAFREYLLSHQLRCQFHNLFASRRYCHYGLECRYRWTRRFHRL
jgi:hypothetical protein